MCQGSETPTEDKDKHSETQLENPRHSKKNRVTQEHITACKYLLFDYDSLMDSIVEI